MEPMCCIYHHEIGGIKSTPTELYILRIWFDTDDMVEMMVNIFY